MKRLSFLILTFIVWAYSQSSAQEIKQKVFTFDIKQDIGPAANRSVKLALAEAEALEVDYILIEIDTYGGLVTDADEIRKRILETKIPVFAFINKNAASAGALISIACDSIYMAPGASIGAATVVNATDGTAAPDKYQSYMRSMMRSTAEATGRNPQIAEAMVDEKLVVGELSDEKTVITLTVSEAIQNGYCEGEFVSQKELLEALNLGAAEVIVYKEEVVDAVIAFFLNPAISGILILLIIGGIYFELQSPGIGFPLALAGCAALLYFIPYYLTGLAENWEILIFVIGIVLLVVEFFIIPGFGIFGIAGIVMTLGGLILAMLPNDSLDFSWVPSSQLGISLLTVVLATLLAVALVFWITPKVNEWGAFKHLTLATTQDRLDGYTASSFTPSLLGKVGRVHSRLRPSGKITLEGEVFDAYSRGDFIEEGELVEVISTEGISLRVKKYESKG